MHIDIYDDRMEIYSPGGMPDGSMIQDRDPLTVPSTRRNPVLADVFNRLGYMERKGSGFGKIISGYEFQINYNESKKPSFRSDRYQFTVVMPVFCKPFLHKIAKSFCRLLHLHFVGNCKTTAGSYSASHKPLQIIFSCYNTRYGNGSSEFSSSCACSLK